MGQYCVTERQVILVEYHVKADSADEARMLVQSLGCREYDKFVSIEDTSIIETQKLEG